MKRATAARVRKAEADFATAQQTHRRPPPRHDIVTFHCQQCAEKFLKALLEEASLPIPKTHDLVGILSTLVVLHPSLRSSSRGMGYLTNFAVAVRYPGFNATKRQAKAAQRWAGRIRRIVRTLLGIWLPKTGKGKRTP